MVLPLGDARGLAAPAAQVIELGTADLAAADDLDGIDHGRIEREHALDALTVGNLAHRKVLVESRAGAADADAFIGLDAGALPFDHLVIDENRITRPEFGDFLPRGKLCHLLLFELLNEIHRNSPSDGGNRTFARNDWDQC